MRSDNVFEDLGLTEPVLPKLLGELINYGNWRTYFTAGVEGGYARGPIPVACYSTTSRLAVIHTDFLKKGFIRQRLLPIMISFLLEVRLSEGKAGKMLVKRKEYIVKMAM